MKRLTKLLFLAGAFAAIASTANAQLGKVKAFMIRGDVTYVNNATGQEAPLRRGMELTSGNTVVTGENATCLLLFSNGASINLTPGSKLDVSKFEQQPFDPRLGTFAALKADPSKSDTEINLAYGEIIGEVKKIRSDSEFTVKTPTGAAGIRGTRFVVSFDGETTTVTNLDGVVVATFGGNVVNLQPGEKTTMTAAQIAENAEAVVASTTGDEQVEAKKALVAATAAGSAAATAETEARAQNPNLSADAAARVGDQASQAAFAAAERSFNENASDEANEASATQVAETVAARIVTVVTEAVTATEAEGGSAEEVAERVEAAAEVAADAASDAVIDAVEDAEAGDVASIEETVNEAADDVTEEAVETAVEAAEAAEAADTAEEAAEVVEDAIDETDVDVVSDADSSGSSSSSGSTNQQ